MKKKIFSVLFALVLVLTMSLVAAPVGADPGPIFGFWEPGNPAASSTVQYSTTQAYSPTYSVYLKALKAESPTDDNKEIYVGEPTGVTTLNTLTNVSFWYYAATGSDPVPPQIDIWLDTDTSWSYGPPPTGDDEWLLGQFPVVTTWGTWVFVPHSAITWIRGMDGKNYGTGSAGLTAAKGDHGTDPVLAIGIQVGSSATRATTRAGDQEFYVDDLTINAITYDLGPTSSVGMTTNVPDIVAISVSPPSINFGTVYPGQTATGPSIVVSNIGTHEVDVNASIPTGTVLQYLQLDPPGAGWSGRNWPNIITDLAMGVTAAAIHTKLPVPSGYTPSGPEVATLLFVARASP